MSDELGKAYEESLRNASSQSRNRELAEWLRLASSKVTIHGLAPMEGMVYLLSEAANALMRSETPRRVFEEQPFAWAVKLKSGVESLVYHPIGGTLELQDGDVAYPLYREVYTQEQLDAAKAEAAQLLKGIKIE